MESKIILKIEGEGASAKTLKAVEKWIHLNPVFKNLVINIPIENVNENSMGIDPILILEIIMGSKVLTELIKCVREWKAQSGSKVIITIKDDDKFEYKIEMNGDIVNNIIQNEN